MTTYAHAKYVYVLVLKKMDEFVMLCYSPLLRQSRTDNMTALVKFLASGYTQAQAGLAMGVADGEKAYNASQISMMHQVYLVVR